MTNEVQSEKRGNVLIVTFNRPGNGNALTFDMATQLFNVLKPATVDRGIRAVMLQGAGGTFMNGFEMAMFATDFNVSIERANQMIQPYHGAIRELTVMDKPVLGIASGMTAGPGMSFLLACDLVIAARSAMFNCKFASYGMTPDGGCSMMLTRRVGSARAAELLMFSEDFGAERAEQLNLINAVVDDAKLNTEALAWIDRLANGPTRVYGGMKKLIAKSFEQDINAQLSLEHTHWGASARGFDFREAIKANAAKRPAKFTGS